MRVPRRRRYKSEPSWRYSTYLQPETRAMLDEFCVALAWADDEVMGGVPKWAVLDALILEALDNGPSTVLIQRLQKRLREQHEGRPRSDSAPPRPARGEG